MADRRSINIGIDVDMPHDQVRAVADQMARVAKRWLSLAQEMDALSTLMAPQPEEPFTKGQLAALRKHKPVQP